MEAVPIPTQQSAIRAEGSVGVESEHKGGCIQGAVRAVAPEIVNKTLQETPHGSRDYRDKLIPSRGTSPLAVAGGAGGAGGPGRPRRVCRLIPCDTREASETPDISVLCF